MNARLLKETRALLPMFAGTLPLIVVLQLMEPTGIGAVAFAAACIVMAGSIFGTEFQHRTVTLLLSQPVARSAIWREKMLVLGAGIMASLAALLICVAVSAPHVDGQDLMVLMLAPLCAFCGAPYWTLLMRHGIVGMVMAVGAPSSILAAYALVTLRFGEDKPAVLVSGVVGLLLIYCAVVYWRGYVAFKRLEAVDLPARELGLPASLEAILVAPLTKASARFRGPFATLLKKEFRMQQISFLVAGVFVLIAVTGLCLAPRYLEAATGILLGDIATYVLVLPLIVGAVSVAEEKGWGVAEWHLTLPPSSLNQWSIKMLAVLATSLVLGFLLPCAVILVVDPVLNKSGARGPMPPLLSLVCWALAQLSVTSVAVYGASIARTTLQAMLSAIAMLTTGAGAVALAIYSIHHVARVPVPWIGHSPATEGLMLFYLASALLCVLCMCQWFAWVNYRRSSVMMVRLIAQITGILFTVWLLSWFFFSALISPNME
jgi:hypothetical protein